MGVRSSHPTGFSLLETTLSLGLVGLLGAAGLPLLETRGLELNEAQVELKSALQDAQMLARLRGRSVRVGLRTPADPDVLPLRVSPPLRWGKPPHIPLPPGMDPTVKAADTGEAHPIPVVTPHRTAQASAWFLHDGREALCMRLNGHGHVQVLRRKADRRRWIPV